MMRVARGFSTWCARSILMVMLCLGALAQVALAQSGAPPAPVPVPPSPPVPPPAAPPKPAAPPAGGWEFEITPYIWGSGLSGDVKVGRLAEQGVEATFSDITKALDIAAMAAFEGRKGRVGFLVDAIYFDLSETEPTPNGLFGDAEVGMTQKAYTVAGTYRIVEGRISVDLVGGVRYGEISADLELTSGTAAGRQAGADVGWWDGLVGARVKWAFAKKWSLVGYGDIGGGGSQLSWQALAGFDWAFSRHLAAKFGYRYMSVDLEKDDLVYDMDMAGAYAGLGIRF